MRAVLPCDRFPVDQTDEGLVDECGGLEAVFWALSGHAAAGNPVELLMDEWDQPLEGTFVALTPLEQQRRDGGGVFRSATILTRDLSMADTNRRGASARYPGWAPPVLPVGRGSELRRSWQASERRTNRLRMQIRQA